MSLDRIVNVMGTIVVVAGITAAVSNPNTSAVISALGNAFSGSIRAALGRNG